MMKLLISKKIFLAVLVCLFLVGLPAKEVFSVDIHFRLFVSGGTPIPEAPTDLAGVALSDSQISLSWTASGTSTKNYNIYRDDIFLLNVVESNYLDTELSPNTAYRYYVVAYDEYNRGSPPSEEITVVTLVTPVVPSITPITGGGIISGSIPFVNKITEQIDKIDKYFFPPADIDLDLVKKIDSPSDIKLTEKVKPTPESSVVSIPKIFFIPTSVDFSKLGLWFSLLLLLILIGLGLKIFVFPQLKRIIIFFFFRQKPTLLGVVYDSVTKRPVSKINVMVFQNNKSISHVTTNKKGQYRLVLRSGEYTMLINNPEFIFPSELQKNKTVDGEYCNLYFGQKFLCRKGVSLNFNIPIDKKMLD